MPFSYHPPTRKECAVCDQIAKEFPATPLVSDGEQRAIHANNYPIHNWYNFVLGYSPRFPEYILERFQATSSTLVADPFMGAGTTLVACKMKQIPSWGIDANNFMVDAVETKLNWSISTDLLRRYRDDLEKAAKDLIDRAENNQDEWERVLRNRPSLLLSKYMSDDPFVKARIISDTILMVVDLEEDRSVCSFFELALQSILVPISNVRYGPGFGIGKPKDRVDVLSVFLQKVDRMISDLEGIDPMAAVTPSEIACGDTRNLTDYLEPNSVSYMITSPPYPGDHEYTKHTKVELLFGRYASDQKDFQSIKRRMIRASTTNIYKDDGDGCLVSDVEDIRNITDEIQRRLDEDGGTSGFERLYTRLVWEYFGGMKRSLEQCYTVMKSGGKIALLVSDSHAFKMLHIETAKILSQIGVQVGFVNPEIELWQNKSSTSHRYALRENILVLTKP